jgi:hypothetical protein
MLVLLNWSESTSESLIRKSALLQQDLLFETWRIDRLRAYRIRPYHLLGGQGANGNDILEMFLSLPTSGNQRNNRASQIEVPFAD